MGFISLAKTEKGREDLIEQTRELIKYLEKELAGKDYFGGKTVGFLDFVAGSMIPFCLERAWEGMGVEMITEEKFSVYNKWVKKLKEVEIVKDCIPPREKHIQHMINMGKKIRSG